MGEVPIIVTPFVLLNKSAEDPCPPMTYNSREVAELLRTIGIPGRNAVSH